MATANFQLQPAINSFIERLKSKGGFTSDDLDELHTHLVDSIQDMQSKGFTPEESFLVSSCRIGDENELSEEYQKVNGAISGRPTLFLIITGMLLFFQLFLLWTLLMSLSQVIALQLGSSSEGFFFINLFFSIVIISIYFVLLNSGKSIAQLENKFHKNRVKFSIVLFCLSLLLSIFFIYISTLLNSNIYSELKSKGRIPYYYSYTDLNFWLVPSGFLLVSLFFLFKRESEKFSLQRIINKGGIIFFISMGVVWETISAYTRFITRGFEMLLSAIIFAVFFSIAVFILARYLDHRPFQKILAFLGFAFIIELAGGFLNPLLTMGAFLSVFFYCLVGVAAIGYLSGRYFYNRSNSFAVQSRG